MSVVDIVCAECGESEWTFVFEQAYPERRQERNQTVKEVYSCDSCGAEGRRFDQQNSGTVQLSGAMRGE